MKIIIIVILLVFIVANRSETGYYVSMKKLDKTFRLPVELSHFRKEMLEASIFHLLNSLPQVNKDDLNTSEQKTVRVKVSSHAIDAIKVLSDHYKLPQAKVIALALSQVKGNIFYFEATN